MRQITRAMLNAINSQRNNNYSVENWKCDNTQVYSDRTHIFVTLHGNNIARYNRGTKQWEINNCGWNTRTTNERLHAIVNCYSQNYVGICSKGLITGYKNNKRIIEPMNDNAWTAI